MKTLLPKNDLSNSSSRFLDALGIFVLCAFGYLAYLVFSPFLYAIGWSIVLVVVTWPIYRRLNLILPKRPNLTALAMVSTVLLILLGIFVPLGLSLAKELGLAAKQLGQLSKADVSLLEERVSQVPFLGETLVLEIKSFLSGTESFVGLISEYQRQLIGILTLAARGVASTLANVFLCIFCAFFLYRDGKSIASQFRYAVSRLTGPRFNHLVSTMRATIRATLWGVLATAVAQGLLAGIGYFITGVPMPLLLAATTTTLSLIPLGTPFVYLPAAGYLIYSGSLYSGLLLILWGVCIVSAADNVLRPLFLSKGAKTPVFLAFVGIVGGVVNFGMLGVFIGPVIMAVALALWLEWSNSVAATDSQ